MPASVDSKNKINVRPTAGQLQTKRYGSEEKLEKTADSFILQTELSV